MKRRIATITIAALTLACGESSVSSPRALEPGFIRLSGEFALDASGIPTDHDKTVVPATSAVAVIDSVAGPYILAFQDRGSGVGDFFILRVNDVRTGTFGPCADGPPTTYPDGSVVIPGGACQVRLLEGVRSSGNVFSSKSFLQSVGGTVQVSAVGDRLVGTVSNLRLRGSPDSTKADVTITSGEFDLPLLRGNAAQVMEACFLSRALGRQCDL